jgi:hypothetical protein
MQGNRIVLYAKPEKLLADRVHEDDEDGAA